MYRLPSVQERERARASLGIEDGEAAFIFVGRFVEKKGLALLSRLACATPQVRWLFAGRGPLDPVKWELPNVSVFRGRSRETLRDLLWAADLMVLPSVGEGFPLVVQEATACGLPSLISAPTLDGFPAAKGLLFCEALGPGAEERWASRLRAIAAGREARPTPEALAAFAARHWSWEPILDFYRQRFAALAASDRRFRQ
ncbi:MAG: glycosyltransferase family 4 protein [Steroidobacteraceae bacterium]